MKKSTILAFALCCATAATGDPSIEWLGTVHNFGAFSEDKGAMTATFSFVNTGDEDVTVISATATCGCTKPKYNQAPVAPGDTASIVVSFDPGGRPGSFAKQVYVRTTASPERTRLELKGTVIGSAETIKARYPVSAGPLKLRSGAVMVGRVYADSDKIAYIDAYNLSADTLQPVASGLPKYITAETVPEVVAPGEMATINLYFSGDMCPEWGMVTDSVTIHPTPEAEGITIPVVALVEENFSKLTPQQLASAPIAKVLDDKVILQPIPENSTTTATASTQLTNTGQNPLIIRRIYSEDPGISASADKSTVESGESAVITVSCDPSIQPTGIINGKISVIVNDPVQPTLTIRVVGERK